MDQPYVREPDGTIRPLSSYQRDPLCSFVYEIPAHAEVIQDIPEPDAHTLHLLQDRILQRMRFEQAHYLSLAFGQFIHQQAHALGLTEFDRDLMAQHHRDVQTYRG